LRRSRRLLVGPGGGTDRMTIASLKILCEITFPDETIARLWDGSAPYLDADGNLWRACALGEGLDVIEAAINGEAATLSLGLSGVDQQFSDLAWEDEQA